MPSAARRRRARWRVGVGAAREQEPRRLRPRRRRGDHQGRGAGRVARVHVARRVRGAQELLERRDVARLGGFVKRARRKRRRGPRGILRGILRARRRARGRTVVSRGNGSLRAVARRVAGGVGVDGGVTGVAGAGGRRVRRLVRGPDRLLRRGGLARGSLRGVRVRYRRNGVGVREGSGSAGARRSGVRRGGGSTAGISPSWPGDAKRGIPELGFADADAREGARETSRGSARVAHTHLRLRWSSLRGPGAVPARGAMRAKPGSREDTRSAVFSQRRLRVCSSKSTNV